MKNDPANRRRDIGGLLFILILVSTALVGAAARSETTPENLPQGRYDDLSRYARRSESGPPDRVFTIGDYRIAFFDRVRGAGTLTEATPERFESFLHIERALSGAHFLLAALDINLHHVREQRDRRSGQPDLIAETWSGGAHCCFTTYVITLGHKLVVDTIETGDAAIELGSDGDPRRLSFPDTVFAYWNASFAPSPAPRVHLTWVGGAYGLDVPRMRHPRWSAVRLAAVADEVRNELVTWNGAYEACPENFEIHCHIGHRPPTTTPPSILWDRILERIYSHNSRDAIALFQASWPASMKGRTAFWNDFKRRLVSGWIWKRFELGRRLDAAPVLSHDGG